EGGRGRPATVPAAVRRPARSDEHFLPGHGPVATGKQRGSPQLVRPGHLLDEQAPAQRKGPQRIPPPVPRRSWWASGREREQGLGRVESKKVVVASSALRFLPAFLHQKVTVNYTMANR